MISVILSLVPILFFIGTVVASVYVSNIVCKHLGLVKSKEEIELREALRKYYTKMSDSNVSDHVKDSYKQELNVAINIYKERQRKSESNIDEQINDHLKKIKSFEKKF